MMGTFFSDIMLGLLITTAAVLLSVATAAQAQVPPPLQQQEEQEQAPLLGSVIGGTTTADRIEAAETNTGIDIQRISDLLEQAVAHAAIMKIGVSTGDQNTYSTGRAQLSETMWQIRLEVSYITPDQVELVNGLEQREDGIENTELNVTLIDETAEGVQSNTGTVSAMILFNELTPNNLDQIMNRIVEQLGIIKDEIRFSVPLDEVEIIGGMIVPIEQLRELEAQFNPPSNLILE
jgi:hypothetical protein